MAATSHAVASRLAMAPPIRHIDKWNASQARGANKIASGEVVTVGPTQLPGLMLGIPRHAFQGGMATAYRGVEILVEQGSEPFDALTGRLKTVLDAAPQKAVAELRAVTIVNRQDEGYDKYFERQYRIPGFQAVAAGGPGSFRLFGGRLYTDTVVLHELGHVAGGGISSGAWKRAAKQDDAQLQALIQQGQLTPNQLGPIVPDPVRRARWTPRLAPGGVTPYGHDQLVRGNVGEDLAEALNLRSSERLYKSPFATLTPLDGSPARPLTFDEAYPGRAALLALLD